MSIDGHDAVGVLIDDDTSWVHTERAHHVLEFFRTVDDLALVELIGQVGEDVGRQLHTHTDIHSVALGPDVQGITDLLHPLAAASAGGDDALLSFKHFAFAGNELIARFRLSNFFDAGMEEEVRFVLEFIEEILQYDIVDVRSQMTHLGIEQVQVIFQTFFADLCVVVGEQARLLSAVRRVDGVDIFHQFDRFLFADVFIEAAAELIGDVVLAVGECTGTAETIHDGTGRAVDARFDADAVDRALTLFQRTAGFDDRNAKRRIQATCLITGEDASRPCSDDH